MLIATTIVTFSIYAALVIYKKYFYKEKEENEIEWRIQFLK